ncbi:MAG: PspC domain-containing protein [Acidimicrobiia bacterium]|nr:PspC domain-containing protein [Acidimicrobiia bacterium]
MSYEPDTPDHDDPMPSGDPATTGDPIVDDLINPSTEPTGSAATEGAGTEAGTDRARTATGAPGGVGGDTATMAPPPPPPGQPRRLVRDPYTRLGGVASGVAHHYGIDVSVVRIIFVLAALASGFGLLVYLLAWLVIPRADYWPPAGPPRSFRSLSGRDLGLVLAIVGLMVALGFGAAGASGGFLIPLVLVGGGVWLLVQPPTEPEAGPRGEPAPTVSGYSSEPPPPPYPAPPVGAPVPPRSRKRLAAVIVLALLAVLVAIALPVLLFIAVVFGIASGEVSFADNEPSITYVPDSISDLPVSFDEDGADLVIDLTRLDAADFAGRTEPVAVDARVDVGEITVIVPDDIDVSVDASVDLGELTVFDTTDDGIRNNVVDLVADADIDLELDLGAGKVTVERE